MEQAIKIVTEIHNVSREVAVDLFWDEVEAAMRLLAMGFLK